LQAGDAESTLMLGLLCLEIRQRYQFE